MITTVKLPSDGKPVEVTVMELFGLDEVAPEEEMGPFLYPIGEMGGKSIYAVYRVEDLEMECPKPDIPKHECKKGSLEYERWLDYETHQAAIAHYTKQAIVRERYMERCAAEVLKKCLRDEDRHRIITDEDIEAVVETALTPEVTERMIVNSLDNRFKASFENEKIMDAIKTLPESNGEVRVIRLWERELQLHMQLSIEDYGRIPVRERADLIVTMKLPQWINALEMEKHYRESKKK